VSLLNEIGNALGLFHFSLEDSNVFLAGSVGNRAPSPLRVEAALIFDRIQDERSNVLSDRLLSTNAAFWLF